MEDASLKVVFSEILRGFTLVDSHDYGKIRVKHFTNFDSAELDIKNKLFLDKAVNQGLPTRDDRIKYLLEEMERHSSWGVSCILYYIILHYIVLHLGILLHVGRRH